MANAVRFLLGFEEQTVSDADPNMTVLSWLRTVAGRCGTKEGCAEGDCGACTVVLGEPDDQGGLRYRAVNACILFLPVLHGRQLVTVEHLRESDGRLHPAQEAMVACHGSQCGFCTPGFVMSLFALFHNERDADRRRIEDVIAGNLCRCTGYRPILDAAQRMLAMGGEDRFSRREEETLSRLRELDDGEMLTLAGAGRRYFAPRTVDALAELRRQYPEATMLAGGTDVGLWVTKQHRDLDTLVYTGSVAGLDSIEEHADTLDIGAAVTHSTAMERIAAHYPDFGELLRRFASVQIRNSGTLGGNIANASPIGDSMPVLIALGAELVLRRGHERRSLPIEDFFLDYRKTALTQGEFLERIRIPVAGADRTLRCYKISKRFDQDISAVCLAVCLRLDGDRVAAIRIGVGGMAAIPARARAVEQALAGRSWNDDAVEAACAVLEREFQPLTDMRAGADYRRLVTRQLLRKCLLETTRPAVATRVLEYREVSA